MKKGVNAVLVGIVVLSCLQFCICADTTSFEDGADCAVAALDFPYFEACVYLSIPIDCYQSVVTVNVSGMAADRDPPVYPKGVILSINNSSIWAFNNTGYGALGRQDEFSTGSNESKTVIGTDGGKDKSFIKIPSGSTIQSANLEMKCIPQLAVKDLFNYTSQDSDSRAGSTVSDAGDVNGDGYDDIIVGLKNSLCTAYIFYGGININSTPDLVLSFDDPTQSSVFSVSGAGDVNNDGFDDVIIGNSYGMHEDIRTGRAKFFMGGNPMDNISDVEFYGSGSGDHFGTSVSGAGDVNGDGFDDIIIGADENNSGGKNAGAAYLYFGGQQMDANEDIKFTGTSTGTMGDLLGCSVSKAGDMNNDGYDEVIVGAYGRKDMTNGPGAANIYFGGSHMDNVSDVTLFGLVNNDFFGTSVSDAGDVNNDGYDDVIVGAYASMPGRCYLFLGAQPIDNVPDVIFQGATNFEKFGTQVSSAGDVNNDGFADVLVGAPPFKIDGVPSGRCYLYYGGILIDTKEDLTFDGEPEEYLGTSISSAGDVNGDGYGDIIIGGPRNDAGGIDAGKAYIYSPSSNSGVLNPAIMIGSSRILNRTGYFNGTATSDDFSDTLNDYLYKAVISGTDSFGISYVNLQLNISTGNGGTITLKNLNITYAYKATTNNFAHDLNRYLVAHQSDKDINGTIRVPIIIRSQSAGRVMLSGLQTIRASAPVQIQEIGTLELDEDMAVVPFLDLYQYFRDNVDSNANLSFSIASSTNSTTIRLWITAKRYLSVDAMTGGANDNWTGTVEAVVVCANSWGASTRSNQFTIQIKNVNDPPVIISTPGTRALAGIQYNYNITAIDGDNDPLRFSLAEAPANMTLGPDNGFIQWMPAARGNHTVSINVTDGNATTQQNYTIEVPNKAPKITSAPPLTATTGVEYRYQPTARDDNLDELRFSLSTSAAGVSLEAGTGAITWTPRNIGNFDFTVTVSDGITTEDQKFTVHVVQGNRLPHFNSTPITSATVDFPYVYNTMASDPDGDDLTFTLPTCPSGMAVDPATGKISWIPSIPGNFSVVLKISDGRGGEATQEFTITVQNRTRPIIDFKTPSEGQKVRGKLTVTGTTTRGTLDIVKVQLRVDSGEWLDAAGNSTWTYSLDTTKLKDGRHTFQARAFDGKDYSDIVKRTVIVDNAKPAAKGFIPGFDGTLVATAISVMALAFVRRKRGGSQ
jgi:hypothetical protein